MLFLGVFLHETTRAAAKSRTNLSPANGPVGPEVAPPSVFHGHNLISNCSYELLVLPLSLMSAHLISA